MLRLSEDEIRNSLQSVWNAFPQAREHAHHQGHPAAWDFNILAGKLVQAENVKAGGSPEAIGCNWRRAVVGDLSMDGLSVLNPADGRYYFKDIVVGAGGPNPRIEYRHPFTDDRLLRDASGAYAPHGYADPRKLTTHFQYDAAPVPPPVEPPPPVITPPAPVPVPPPVDNDLHHKIGLLMTGQSFLINGYAAGRKDADELRRMLAEVVELLAHARLEIAEARAALDRPMKIEASNKYLGAINGTVKHG
jgi:hypothetical protein